MVQKWEKIGEGEYKLQLSENDMDTAYLEKEKQYDEPLESVNLDKKAYAFIWICGEHLSGGPIFAQTDEEAIQKATRKIKEACTEIVNDFSRIRDNLPEL